jgi:hypothetical protein
MKKERESGNKLSHMRVLPNLKMLILVHRQWIRVECRANLTRDIGTRDVVSNRIPFEEGGPLPDRPYLC